MNGLAQKPACTQTCRSCCSAPFDLSLVRGMACETQVQELWEFLGSEAAVAQMEAATAKGESAIEPLVPLLMERLSNFQDCPPETCAALSLRMIKKIMESRGYRHVACRLLPSNPFVQSAGLFSQGPIAQSPEQVTK